VRRLSSGFVLGYHGCDAQIAERLLKGEPFKTSDNDYDWLGAGIYFWESNPQRGLEFAQESTKRKGSGISDAAVVGAVLDLGLCLDLTTKDALGVLRLSYEALTKEFELIDQEMPKNGANNLLRRLDCAVVTKAHEVLKLEDIIVDSVRGIFTEGEPLYNGSGFQSKTHTQVAIRNPDLIKGVFRVPKIDLVGYS
jgi:hypothetical protein